MVAIKQQTQVFGGEFGGAINVLGAGGNCFGNPGSRFARGRAHGIAKHRGGAGEYEGANLRSLGGLQQGKGAAYVGCNKLRLAVGGDVGLVQGGGVEHHIYTV